MDVCDDHPPIFYCFSHNRFMGGRTEPIPAWKRHKITHFISFLAANLSLYRQRNNSPLTIWATLTDLYALWNVFLLSLTFFSVTPTGHASTSITAGLEDNLHHSLQSSTWKRWVTSAQLLHLLQRVKRFLVGFLMTDVHQTEKLRAAQSVLISYRLFLSARGALLSRNIPSSQTESATFGWFFWHYLQKASVVRTACYQCRTTKTDHSSVREHSLRHQPDEYRDRVLSLFFLWKAAGVWSPPSPPSWALRHLIKC